MEDNNIEHLKELLERYKQNLRKLEEQKSQYGIAVPLDLMNNIEYQQSQIDSIQRQLGINTLSSSSADLHFVNQQEALNNIIINRQANNFIIDAPIGYGKTRLLKELSIRFSSRGWYVRIVSLDALNNRRMSEHDAITIIAKNFGIQEASTAEETGRLVASYFHQQCMGYSAKSRDADSFLMLDNVDVIRDTDNTKVYPYIQQFFNGLRQGMKSFRDCNRIRIVLAGRYIGHYETTLGGSIPIKLEPFDRGVIKQAIELRFQEFSEEKYQDLAACACYVTGGHPGMIYKLLTDEEIGIVHQPTIETLQWMIGHQHHIGQRLITPVIDDIRERIPKELWEVLEIICVYRRFTRHIINQIIAQNQHIAYRTSFELIFALKRAKLIDSTPVYLKEGILRPALVRWLQFSIPDRLDLYCQNAYTILVGQLQNPRDISRIFLLTEILYTILLQYHSIVLSVHKDVIRQNAFNDVSERLREHIQTCFSTDDDQDERIGFFDDLHTELSKDHEIEMLFDYTVYSNVSYKEFIQDICTV